MAERKFNIYKGMASKIYVTIKNSDRKVVPAAGKIFFAYVVSNSTERLMLKRQLDEIDAARGEWELTLFDDEVALWPTGCYRLVVTIQDEDDEYGLYGNLNYGPMVEVWLHDNALPASFKPIESIPKKWQERIGVFYSSAYPGDAQLGRHDGLHTIDIYSTNFSGKFWVQVSLDPSIPTSDTGWDDIELNGDEYVLFDEETGNQEKTFTINAQWIRFRYVPDDDNEGTIDKIVYHV